MLDFLNDEVEIKEVEEVAPTKTSLLDNIAILTYLKKLKPILANDGFFFGIYNCVMAKNGQVYDNLTDVVFTEKDCPPTELNEVGVGKKVEAKLLDISYPKSLIQYLSFHNDTLLASYYANQVADMEPEAVALVLEKHLPKRKLFIKNLGIKIKNRENKQLLEDVQRFFKVSFKQADEYLERIETMGRLEEFEQLFAGGEEKPKKEKKEKKEKVNKNKEIEEPKKSGVDF